MAKKRQEAPEIQELKQYLQQDKLVFGREEVLKRLQRGELTKVFVARNVPQKEALEHLCAVGNVSLVTLEQDHEEVGILCKKNFFVSVIGVLA